MISDIFIPDLDGYEFLKRIKSHPVWCDIPFIYMSGISSKEKINLCFDL